MEVGRIVETGAHEELGMELSDAALAKRTQELAAAVSVHLPFLGKVRGGISADNVADMLENARRRIADQERYDDGVARLYRCVEMHHQRRLAEHGVSAGGVDWEGLATGERERFLGETGLDEPPEVLGLRQARVLDRILNGEEAGDEPELRDLLQKRNRSILDHGLEPVAEKTALRFLDYVEEAVDLPEGVRAGARHATLRGM